MKKRILALFMAFLFVMSSINVFPAAANDNVAEEDVPVVDTPVVDGSEENGGAGAPDAGTSHSADFTYVDNGDKTCTVTGYKGGKSATALFIPSEIDGLIVTAIGEGAFAGFKNLTRAELPDTLYSIGNRAFERCYNFRSLFVPPNVFEIAGDAFWECYNLQFYTYPVCGAYYALQNAGYGYNVVEFEHEHDYSWSETQNPTCTNIGLTYYRCSMCPYFYADAIPTVDHSFATREVEASCEEGAYTETYCTACGDSDKFYKSEPLGHTYGDWVVIEEGYCDSIGAEAKECTVCKWSGPLRVFSNDLPSCTGEDYKNDMEVVYDTFTYPGAFGLSISFDNSELEAPGDRLEVYSGSEATEENLVTTLSGEFWGTHVEGDSFTLKLITDGSGTSKGFEVDYVEVYHEDFIRETPPLGHDFEETSFDATCEAAAHVKKVCQREYCGLEEIEYTGEPLGHTYGDWVTVHENPCVEWGYEARACTVCGEAGPLVARKEFPSCILQGEVVKRDVVYDTVSFPGAEKIVINFHEFSSLHDGEDFLYVYEGEYEEGEEPLLALTGYFTKAEINAESFTLRLVTVSDNPYYGFKIESLEVHDDAFVKDIAPKGHTFGDFEKVSDATCTEEGIYARVCSVCGNAGSFPYRSDDLPSCKGYTNNMYKIFDTFTYEGAVKLVIHFTEDTELEENWDVLYVYEGAEVSDDALVSELTGKFSEVTVNGDSFTFLMTSDMSVQRKGFEIDYIEVYHSDYVEITPALGHSFGEFETVKEANCYESGFKVATCSACGLAGKCNVTDNLPSCTGEDYRDDMYDVVGTYSYPGADKLILHFSENTYLEENCDYLFVFRDDQVNDDHFLKSFTGSFSEMEIEGDTFTLLMNTDGSQQTYGFEVEYVEVFYKGYYEIIPAGDHSYETYEVISEADCDTDGIVNLKCSDCGFIGIRTEDGKTLPQFVGGNNVDSAHTHFEAVTYEGAEKIELTFTEDSLLRNGCNYLYIYKGDIFNEENLVATLTGDLSGKKVVINGDSFCMRMFAGEDYLSTGFAFESAVVYTAGGYVLTPALGHSFDEWIVVSEANCVESGFTYGICSVCGTEGYTKDESDLPSCRGDEYENDMFKVFDTYFVPGAKKYVITFGEDSNLEMNCDVIEIYGINERGEEFMSEQLTGDFSGYKTTVNASSFYIRMRTDMSVIHSGFDVVSVETYVEEGYVETPALGHKPESFLGKVDVTCTTDGYTEYVCSVCGENYHDEIITAPGHAFPEWIVVSEATCDTQGIAYSTCEVCGLTGKETIEDDEALPSCTGEDYRDNMSECSDVYTVEGADRLVITFGDNSFLEIGDYIDVYRVASNGDRYHVSTLGGDIGGLSVSVEGEAFCVAITTNSDSTAYGYEVEKVEAYYAEAMQITPSLGHYLGEEYTVIEPTCTKEGYTRYTCTVCSQPLNIDYTPSLGHNITEWNVVKAPTCTEEGIEAAFCDRCSVYGYRELEKSALPSCRGEELEQFAEVVYDTVTAEGSDRIRITFSEDSTLGEYATLNIYAYDRYGNRDQVNSLSGDIGGKTYDIYYDNFEFVLYMGYRTDDCNFEVEKVEAFMDSAYCYVSATGHTSDGNATEVPPTCSSMGYTEYTCITCGESYKENFIERLPHVFGEMTESYVGLCHEQSYVYAVCELCGSKGYNKDTSENLPSCRGEDYTDNMNKKFDVYSVPGATRYRITFADNSYLEENWDFVWVYVVNENGEDYSIGGYTGSLSGMSVEISASSFYLVVVTDTSNQTEGFEVASIEAFIDGAYVESEAVSHDLEEIYRYDGDCVNEGYVDYQCTRCGYSETVTIPAPGHDYETTVYEMTCTQDGYTEYKCTVCGVSNVADYVEAPGHQFGEFTEVKSVTCYENGLSFGYCERCGIAGYTKDESDTLPSCTGDDYTDNMEKQYETYTFEGANRIVITFSEDSALENNCDYLYFYTTDESGNVEEIDYLTGDFGGSTMTVYSDNFHIVMRTDGSVKKNGFEVVSIEAYVDGGYEEVYSEGHDMETVSLVPPTCTSYGENTAVCRVCGYEDFWYTPMLDHEYEETYTAPTCSSAGMIMRMCKRCESGAVEAIEPLGHNIETLDHIFAPTCTEAGYSYGTCTTCGTAGYVRDEGENLPTFRPEQYDGTMYTETVYDIYATEGDFLTITFSEDSVLHGNSYLVVYGVNADGSTYYVSEYRGDFGGETCTVYEKGFRIYLYTYAGDEAPNFSVERVESFIYGGYDIISATGHTKGEIISTVEPTCITDGYTEYICSDCDEVMTEDFVPSLGHSFGELETVKPATCTENGYNAARCAVCGVVGYTSDETGLPSCTGSDYTHNMNKTFDTYTAEGASMLKIYFGTGELESNYDKLYVYGINEYGEEYQLRMLTGSFSGTVVEVPYESFYLRMTTDGSVTRSGFVVEKVEAYYEGSYEETEALGHEVEEISRTDATCDTDGVIEYKCIRCDHTEYGYIPAFGHEWEVSVVEPTCSVDGYTLHHCITCGTDEKTDTVPKTGHVFGDMTEEFSATCTESGYKYAVCEVCSFAGYSVDTSDDLPSCTENEYQNNMNKTFDTYTVEGADSLVITFSGNSYTEYYDKVYVYAVHPVNGTYLVRTLSNGFGGTKVYIEAPAFYIVMTTDYSRTYYGFEVEKVEAFGNGGFEAASALGHDLYEVSKTEPDCYNQGVTEYGCTRCDHTEFTYVPALSHEYKATVYEPTCVADGYTEYICSLCQSTYRADYVQAKGHSDVHVETVEPTCVEAGYDRYECEVCGESYMISISPTGHKMGEWQIEKEPLLLEEGLRSRTCESCYYTETEVMDKIVPDIDSGDYGLAHFTVVNATTLEPISGAQLFVSTKEDGETTLETDGNGKVSAYLPVGALTVSAYAEGCIIRNLKFDIVAGEKDYPNIGLSDMSLYDVEITSKVMTQEEIIDAGIDITHPDNQHVVKYEMKIQYEPEIDWESITFYFNAAGNYIPTPDPDPDPDPDEPEEKPPVLHYHVVGTEPEHKYCRVYEEEMGDLVKLNYEPSRPDLFYRFNGWYEDPQLTKKITHKEITEKVNYVYGEWEYFGPEREEEPTPPKKENDTLIYPVSENFYLIVRGEVQWQKEMFDVEMLIVNNSLTDDMEHVNATLNLPDGLSLATMTGEQQSASQFVGMVPAGETRSVHWYVRGDKAGSYALEARLQGVMMPFNEEIDQVFVSEKDLQVWAGNALHLHFEFPDAAYYAEDYPMTITLTNVSDITLYNVSHAVQLVQGMEVYYSDGSEKRAVEPSFWNSIGVDELHPGDSIVIETTTNIFFESEIMEREIQRYISLVDGAEILYKGAQVVTTIIEILTFSVDCVETCETALDVVFAAFDDFDEKLEWLGFLIGQIGDLNDMIKRYSDAAIDASFQPLAEEVIAELAEINEDPFGWYASHSIEDIIELVSKIEILNKQIKSSAVSAKFDVFDSIRTAISAIPIKFAFSSLTMNQESETTTIPYSYNAYDAGPRYFGVSSVSKYLESLTIAVAGTLYEDIVPWYARLIPGIDDPMGMEEAVEYIKTTEKEIAKIQAKDSTGEITFKVWVERNPATYNMRGNVSRSTEDFIISCDNENAVYEDGKLTFTGNGNIMVEPQTMNGGTLYIEDSEGNLYTYVIDVVEQHECSAEDIEVIIAPTANTDGFAVKKCEVCEDILDIIPMSAAECEHDFTEWETVEVATCASVGLISRSCELCGMLEQQFTEMLPHTEGEWTVTVEPTCSAFGTETTDCTVCGRALERDVAMTEHTEGEWVVAVEPTPFKTGLNELHCADCYVVIMTVEIPMTEETFGLELENESRIVTGLPSRVTVKMLVDHYENMGMSIIIKDANGNTPRQVATGCIIEYEGVEFTVAVKGDINGDGDVNARDMIALKQHLMAGKSFDKAQSVAADINGDNKINARDTIALKRTIA